MYVGENTDWIQSVILCTTYHCIVGKRDGSAKQSLLFIDAAPPADHELRRRKPRRALGSIRLSIPRSDLRQDLLEYLLVFDAGYDPLGAATPLPASGVLLLGGLLAMTGAPRRGMERSRCAASVD